MLYQVVQLNFPILLAVFDCVYSPQNPNLNFKEVTYELDHPGFLIRDSKGLQIVVYGVQRGLGMEVFPVDLIYRPWKHAEGQVRFLIIAKSY